MHASHRSRQLDTNLGAVQLQDDALLVLQLHAASAGSQGTPGADRTVVPAMSPGLRMFKARPTKSVVEAPIVAPMLIPETLNG